MRTLVISDLHLGVRTCCDVLTGPDALNVLLERLDGVDRLVLLGDTLELRHGPARDALAAAEPVMRAIGDAIGPGSEIVLVPGNHDHAIAAGWLDWRGRRDEPDPLGLEERIAGDRGSWISKRLTGWLSPAPVQIAYPGLWLRDDVYAFHGHYLDAHVAIPTLERLAAGVMGRMVGAIPDPATPDDYEAILAPLYALSQASAQRGSPARRTVGSRSAAGTWETLAGAGPRRKLRGYLLSLPFRLGVMAANRAGLGPVQADIGIHDLRKAGLSGIAEAARRLRLSPPHLVFGHTHRTGKLPADCGPEWRTPGGTQLHNAGSWVFDTLFMGNGSSESNPYWPGGAIALDGDGPPRLERLLGHLPETALRLDGR
jgi:predicted phosphodiesterase